jgi:HAMP domain-containing protein
MPSTMQVRVIAEPRFREEAEFIEVVAPHAPLKGELKAYLWQLVFTTLFVAGLAGALVFLSLNFFLVRPMQRITRAMERFRADPDDPAAHLDPSGRRDEIGRAEIELDRMQADLRTALASRARLKLMGLPETHVLQHTGYYQKFPEGWQETAAHFKPLEVIFPTSWRQAVCLVLHGYAVGVGRSGHAIPWSMWNAVQRVMAYVDSYDVIRYDSLGTVQSAWQGAFAISTTTVPDDWNKPCG